MVLLRNRESAPPTDGDVFGHFSRLITISGCGKRFSVAVAWFYFDETINEKTNSMILGGCIAPQDRWEVFSTAWKQALDNEGVSEFHAKDFHAWHGEFAWSHKTGTPDKKRHEAFDRHLAGLITNHTDGAFAFRVPIVPVKGQHSQNAAYRLGLNDALRETLRRLFWDSFQPQYFVIARRSGISPITVLKHFEQLRWAEHLSGCGVFPPSVFLPLQAADYMLSAVNRYEMGERTLSHRMLTKGFHARGKPFLTKIAPSARSSSEWKA